MNVGKWFLYAKHCASFWEEMKDWDMICFQEGYSSAEEMVTKALSGTKYSPSSLFVDSRFVYSPTN